MLEYEFLQYMLIFLHGTGIFLPSMQLNIKFKLLASRNMSSKRENVDLL